MSDSAGARGQARVLVVLFLGVLVAALDIAIVGPALPAIRDAFRVGDRLTSWIFGIYVLFGLVGSLLMSKLSDRVGRRFAFLLDIGLFGAGSLVVAASPAFWVVLVGRAVQGLGAGGVWPIAAAVVGESFPQEKKGRALGMMGAVFGVAFLLGPPLGGALLLLSWRWLFIVNIPLAVLVFILAMRTLKAGRAAKRESFDLRGMTVIGVSLASFAFAVNQIQTGDFLRSVASWRVLPFLLLAVLLFALIGRVEKRARDPIVHLDLLRNRQLVLGTLLGFAAGCAEGSLVFVPAFTVSAFSISESSASFLLIPPVIAMTIGSPTWGWLLNRAGSRRVLASGLLLSTGGLLLLGYLGSNFTFYIVAGVALGFGMSGLLGAPLRYIMANEAPDDQRTVAQGLVTVATSVGQLIAGALVGAIAGGAGGGAVGYATSYRWVGLFFIVFFVLSFGLKSRGKEKEVHEVAGARVSPEGVRQPT